MPILIPRRTLLKGSALAGLAGVPFLGGLSRTVSAANPNMKAIFVYVPDGVIPDQWHPGTASAPFALPQMTSPLQSIENDVLFLRGLDMYSGGATHEGGVAKLLTGVGDQSLDVFLGEQIGAGTPHRSLQLGVAANFQNGAGSWSFVGAGQQVQPNDDPLDAFENIFGSLAIPTDSGQDLARVATVSLIDRAADEVRALQSSLGATQKQKLDVHLESLREVELRLSGAVTGTCDEVDWDSQGFANSETDYYPLTYHKEENFELIGRLQMDLLVLALGCGMTRVGSLMWSHPVSPTRIPATGGSTGHHDTSHYGDSASATAGQFIGYKQWFMQQFVYLIERLRATPDVSGSLLDNTVVFLGTEINDGNLHDHTDMPFLLAGGACGQLATGRALDFRGNNGGENEPHTKLLVSIANMMGVGVNEFGFTGRGTGPLDGLSG